MKTLLLLSSLLLGFVTCSQETERVVIRKVLEEKDFFPSIEGVYRDEIPLEKLGSKAGIQTPLGWEVISFRLGYPSGATYKIVTINAQNIPDSTLLEIRKSCLNEQIHFTQIRAKDPSGVIYELIPMTLIPTWKDDE